MKISVNTGDILYLTSDNDLLLKQLRREVVIEHGEDLSLMDNISTDEITPAWACFWIDDTLARHAYTGLRGGKVEKDQFLQRGPRVLVSGLNKGCGSSRESAPYAERAVGVRIIFAKALERIYMENCWNLGILATTDFRLLRRLEQGEEIDLEDFIPDLDSINADVIRQGGLCQYDKRRLAGQVRVPVIDTRTRPMTLAEKIIASRLSRSSLPTAFVKPGDSVFVDCDVRFSHDYATAMTRKVFREEFGADTRVNDPGSMYVFRDHLTFLKDALPSDKTFLLTPAMTLAQIQEAFAQEQGIRYFGEVADGGSYAICHTAVVEEIATPGQVVVGTDSHTCTAGALGCFAFGVGTTAMASAWYCRQVHLRVPGTVAVRINGLMPHSDLSAKDVMLHLLGTDFVRTGGAIGKVLEFTGPGLQQLSVDERCTLTNMAVEAGATTGIIGVDDVTLEYIGNHRTGLDQPLESLRVWRSDPDAVYDRTIDIELDQLSPMLSLPGDPRNSQPYESFRRNHPRVRIDIAYGGSCTAGKKADLDMYARVLRFAESKNLKIPSHVQFFIQASSQKIKAYAQSMGYLDLFRKAGVEFLDPACGACIRAGRGVSVAKEQVTISAISRNYHGRSGPGQVYLASPYLVAASAIAGEICSFADLQARS